MKEIKFRAWNNDEREMYYDAEYTYDYIRGCPEIPEESFADLLGNYIWTVEQFTGFRDKNSKKIYEGDIVSEHNGDITGEIIQQASGTWLIRWIGGSNTDTSVLFEEYYLCDVIGNIHENPELLEG